MEGAGAGIPVIRLPARVDRRVRLGPFPSASDALKFVCYAALGSVLAPFFSPFAWVPVLAAGFVVSAWRPEGEALDERAGRWLVYAFRRVGGSVSLTSLSAPPVRGGSAVLASGRRVVSVRTGGMPLAYRPPADLALVFERFGDLLRSSGDALVLRSATEPLREGPVLPRSGPCSDAERAAREGYTELTSVLCRRRRARRIDIALGSDGRGAEGERRLDARAQRLAEQLASLGLETHVLRDRALADSVRSFGWTLARNRP